MYLQHPTSLAHIEWLFSKHLNATGNFSLGSIYSEPLLLKCIEMFVFENMGRFKLQQGQRWKQRARKKRQYGLFLNLFDYKNEQSWTWWCMLVIPAQSKMSQEDHKFKDIARSCLRKTKKKQKPKAEHHQRMNIWPHNFTCYVFTAV